MDLEAMAKKLMDGSGGKALQKLADTKAGEELSARYGGAAEEAVRTGDEAQMKAILSKIDKLAATPPPVVTVPTPVSTEAEYDIYEVQKGATLSVIAKAYEVSVQDIKKANNLKSDVLQIGQKLKIPRK